MRFDKFILFFFVVALFQGCKSKDEVAFSFDPVTNVQFLWETIDSKYCFIDEKAINWEAIGKEYIELASQIQAKPIPLFDLCASMLDSLHDGHVNIYTDFDISRAEITADVKKNYKKELQDLYLTKYRIAGGLYYCKLPSHNIGYVVCRSFDNSITSSNLAWIVEQFRGCDGMVLDLRENGGGELSNAQILASLFYTEDEVVGYWQHKIGKGHDDFSALCEIKISKDLTSHKWLEKAAVLTNRGCFSAANFFVNCMKDRSQIKIVGDSTSGGGGMPMSYEMPCGWMIRFSSIRFVDRNKRSIENGIAPDVQQDLISEDKDDIIETAIKLIESDVW